MTAEKVQENRLRRMAERQGYVLQKSRRRDPRAIDYGGYMVIDRVHNWVVFGGEPRSYSASLDAVEAFLLGKHKAERKRAVTRKRS